MACRRLSAILNKSRSCSTSTVTNRENLFSRISHLGDPSVNVIPIIETWLHQGKPLTAQHLNFIIKTLRKRRRFTQALQVSEWMTSEGVYPISPSHHAVQLNLIGRVRGMDSVEWYFLTLNDRYKKTEQLYGALLNCYVREGLVDKSLSLLKKMKEMGFVYAPVEYNNIMSLYTQTQQYENVPAVLAQMKKDGVPPDAFSYRICINSYGLRSDFVSVEKMLKEIKRESHIGLNWITYSMVANYYIKAGLKNNALICLQMCEDTAHKCNALSYNHLISHYASLGDKEAMMRLWKFQKANCNKQLNREYMTMLRSLVKLGDLDETEKLLEEWELSGNDYDFRVPNILLIGYSQRGLNEKAETMLRSMVEKKGRTPIPNSWAIIAAGYVAKENMEKAFQCMKEAVAVQAEKIWWRPKVEVVSSILDWAANNKDIDEVEDFVNSLKTVISMNRDMYLSLIKMYVRYGKEIDEILESMNADKIELDEEIGEVLNSRFQLQ